MNVDAPLPKYDDPPVSEVVMSVAFDPLPHLTPVHLGDWWQGTRRERYPIVEERPPAQLITEDLSERSLPMFSFEVATSPPTPAMWFITSNRNELLQIQRDRFTRNWTRQPGTGSYPSYRGLRPFFDADCREFFDFLDAAKFDRPEIRQCELTYINPIPADESLKGHSDLGGLIAPWSGQYSEPWLPAPENAGLLLRYLMTDPSGAPAGRLHVTLQAVHDQRTARPVYLLTLLARGRPSGSGIEDALAFLDDAHEWIVRGFTAITSRPMHEHWRRTV